MYCGDDVSSVVVDIGSFQVRAGYSGEDCPRSVLPSVLGLLPEKQRTSVLVPGPEKDKQDEEMKDEQEEEPKQQVVVGQTELGMRRDGMQIENLVDEEGAIRFDFLDEFIECSLEKNLKIGLSETPVLFTESTIHNKDMRMKLTEYMFEKYKLPALFLAKDPVLTSFSCGRSSALILDCGHRHSIATPVNDGYALLKCIVKHDIGGRSLTGDLQALLKKKEATIRPRFTFKKQMVTVDGEKKFQIKDLSATEALANTHPSYHEWCNTEMIREIKEDFLVVADDQLQLQKGEDNTPIGEYDLPDGTSLKLSAFERQSIGEKMFQNFSYPDLESPQGLSGFAGVHQMILESIQKSDLDFRKDLFSNIILSGGTTLMRGFTDRVNKLLPEICPQNMRVKVLPAPNSRRFQPWIGGSILSSLGSFQQMWMSRQEYEEHGAIMIERKCP